LPKLLRLTPARLILVVVLIVIGYFAFAAVNDALLSRDLSREEDDLRSQITELTEQKATLEAIRDYLGTSEYIEMVARRVLGLAKPGETVYIVSSTAPPTPAPTATEGDGYERWWERLYGP
jgi:cell division protein FtsB